MSNVYGCDGISSATAERELGLDGRGVDANELERAIEEQAEQEALDGARPFRDFLADYPEHAISIAVAMCVWPSGRHADGHWWTLDERQDQHYTNITEAKRAVEQAYVQHRVNTMPEHERDEIVARLLAERSEA